MKKITISSLLFIFLVQSLLAQDPVFTATTSRSQVGVGEQFQITYALNGNGGNFRSPDMRDFAILSGPNQSSSMSFVNGNMSQSLTFSFVLAAQREGKFTISPASIVVNGKTINSKPLVIEVVKNPSSAQQQHRNNDAEANDNSDLFLRASIDKSKVYVGEQLTVTFKLFTKVSIVQNAMSKAPVFNGFWSEDVISSGQTTLHPEVYEGVQYQVAELKKTILMPQRSGTLEISEMVWDFVKRVQQRNRSNNIFDQFFGGGYQDVRVTAKSKVLKIEVLPLPLAGKPADFTGAVGDFGIESRLSSMGKKLKSNDATNLYITISGKGNLKLIDPFKLKLPPEIESYDAKINDKISTSVNGVSGSRTFDYLMIPRHSGSYKIPSVSFTYFDISKKNYITLNTPEFSIEVEKGNSQESDANSIITNAKEDVKILGNDIRYIKTKSLLTKKGKDFFGSTLFYLLLILPAILFLVFLAFYKNYTARMQDTANIKSKKATKIAKKRLEIAAKHLQAGSFDAFYNELFKAINGYLSDKLNISQAELSKENIREILLKKGTNEQAINDLIDTLNKSEFARFSPVKTNTAMQGDYDNTIGTISKIEAELK